MDKLTDGKTRQDSLTSTEVLTLKAQNKVADNILSSISSEKIRLGISCESLQMIHMNCQALFSLKKIYKKIKMPSVANAIRTWLRVARG